MGTWTTILFIAVYGVLDFQLKLVFPFKFMVFSEIHSMGITNLNLGYVPLRLLLFPLVTVKFGQRA